MRGEDKNTYFYKSSLYYFLKFILKILHFLLVFTCKLKKIGYNIIGNNVCYIKLLRSDFLWKSLY